MGNREKGKTGNDAAAGPNPAGFSAATARLLQLVHFDANGHLPAVIVDDASGAVLTLCYMNREALARTAETGEVWVFRRSLGRLMKKGERSGHTQSVRQILIDCDGRSLVIRVAQKVAACHKGYFSCYFTRYDPATGATEAVGERVFDPEDVYRPER